MKLPNKLFSYNQSIISKFPIVIRAIKEYEDITIFQLYINIKDQFDDIMEFLYTLDCLYSLGKIDYDYKLRRIRYAV
jgi:hypothetical protein